MKPIRDLDSLLRAMQPRLADGVYVFATVAAGQRGALVAEPLLEFREREGITLVLALEAAEAAGLAHEFPCRLITLDVPSSLDAVGFLAVVTGALARAGIPVNVVSAFHHDHLFVPVARAEESMRLLHATQA